MEEQENNESMVSEHQEPKEAHEVKVSSSETGSHRKSVMHHLKGSKTCECGCKDCKCGSRDKKMRLGLLVVSVILVVMILCGLFSWGMNSEASSVNTKEYQAVFLTNGQVYFGKLKVVNHQYLKLTDIYYLQVQQSSSSSSAASQLNSTSNSGSNVQLIKLGNELHGPEDQMSINREQVLFWENLKNNSKVTQAISNYQAK